MLSINTNAASMAAVNAINTSNASLSQSMERLATGNRINSSADDAAGKQIANRLNAQASGMSVAQRNDVLAEAVRGQANLSKLTVRSLLG